MNSFRLLISRYLDGELTDDEVSQLAATLETDAAAINVMVFTSFIHAQLLSWMDQEGEQSRESGVVIDSRESWLAPAEYRPAKSSFIARTRKRFLSWTNLAAALVIAASISAVAYVIASRPVIVGQLTDATNCRWGSSAAGIQVGTLLENNQDLDLLQGIAVITFASGAKVRLEGPTSLHLNSPMNIQLNNGRIATKVPRQAIGFTVNSSLARFVDMGTAYALSLEAEKSFHLDVFEGLVELQLNERFGEAAHRPAQVAAVHAVSFNIRAADFANVPFEVGKKMPF